VLPTAGILVAEMLDDTPPKCRKIINVYKCGLIDPAPAMERCVPHLDINKWPCPYPIREIVYLNTNCLCTTGYAAAIISQRQARMFDGRHSRTTPTTYRTSGKYQITAVRYFAIISTAAVSTFIR